MIPAKPDIFEEGDLDEMGEVIPFLLSEKDMPSLMDHLTNLYSRPEEACVREYSTNANDAHVEAGITRPIELLKPNDLVPNFIVRDYGLGMSLETVRTVFTRYGASTKRHSNGFTGHLGLGCKAGMCYTSQISVKTVWEDPETQIRWKLVGIVARKADNTAGFHVAYHEPTDEPTGTEISVPRQKPGDFDWTVDWFFSFWPEGSALIDGKPSKFMDGKRLGDNVVFQTFPKRNYKNASDYVVMGNVPYQLKEDHKLFAPEMVKTGLTTSVSCWIKMGSVNFTPNREDLIYSDFTKETLRKLTLEVNGRVKWLLSQELDQAPNHWEALLLHHRQSEEYGFSPKGATYRGEIVPTKWPNTGFYHFHRRHHESRATYDRFYKKTFSTDYLLQLAKADQYDSKRRKVVVGAPFAVRKRRHEEDRVELTQAAKTRLRIFAEVKGYTRLVVLSELPDPKWWAGLEVIQWSEVEATRLPREGSVVEGYGFPDHQGHKVLLGDLPKTGVLYAEPKRVIHLSSALTILRENRKQNYVLLEVHPRRLQKFLRLVPGALPFFVVYQGEVERLAHAALSHPSCARVMMGHWDVEFLQGLSRAGKVSDPEIQKLIQQASVPADRAAQLAITDFRDAYQKAVYSSEMTFHPSSAVYQLKRYHDRPVRERISQRYPLISKDYVPHDERAIHVLEYLNWYYETHLDPNLTPTPAEEAAE